ncbi:MAG: ThiF family adenylyltransferase [Gammaproteobacteria bacterium]|nr:ThiF family adenylyltransferase [Gammaproteobacteria bacterium]
MSKKYTRQEQIPGWRQAGLQEAAVIIVGIGALGNEVARILALSGVRRLLLCDPDRVELSNLNRCGLFRESDIGRLKVEAAADGLKNLAPDIKLECRPYPLIHGIGLAELRDASLVMSCLDSRVARLQLAGRCNLVKAPYIDGGTHAWGGEVRPYLEADGPCYGCSLSYETRSQSDIPWSCGDAAEELPQGATAASSVLIASWMSLLAVRFLMRLSCAGENIKINAEQGQIQRVSRQRDQNCPLHAPIETVTRIALSNQAAFADLRHTVGAVDTPLAWEPVQEKLNCLQCGFSKTEWALAVQQFCPQCGADLHIHTTLELSHAPAELRLADLGIAPREILAVRGAAGINWIELKEEAIEILPDRENRQS